MVGPSEAVVEAVEAKERISKRVPEVVSVGKVVEAVEVPVTLKMRTGWDDNSRNAPKLAKIAEDCGVKMVTVHGRTRSQFYKGRSVSRCPKLF